MYTVMILGGAKGVGLEILKSCHKKGYQVAFCGRSKEHGQKIVDESLNKNHWLHRRGALLLIENHRQWSGFMPPVERFLIIHVIGNEIGARFLKRFDQRPLRDIIIRRPINNGTRSKT